MGTTTKKSYLIIGSGRLAQHLSHWLQLKSIPYQEWHYKNSTTEQLLRLSDSCDHLLLCIPDRFISEFVQSFPGIPINKWVHFSGTLELPGINNVHPLMTFGTRLYPLESYEKIFFADFEHSPMKFKALFPVLHNVTFPISSDDKKLYHALCSFTGNLTSLIWSLGSQELLKLKVPEEALKQYQRQTFDNLMSVKVVEQNSMLTGPIARGDQSVVINQISALSKVGLGEIYQAVSHQYQKFTTIGGDK